MRINKNQYDCCGCTACENICPKHAISMQPDLLGFLYPKIDVRECIDCGLCVKICNFSSEYKTSNGNVLPDVFAVRSNNISELRKSQSGAAFFELAKTFINCGGVVYGATLDLNFNVKHIKVSSFDELERLRLSKYTQSQLTTILPQVKRDLRKGLDVLFSGTPCQIAGLNSYIPESLKTKLVTIDVVCHGVPSPYIWKAYLDYIKNKKGEIVECKFRDKKLGWASHFESFLFSSGKTFVSHIYRDLYYSHIMLRYSCYNCPFTNLKRISDISLGDYWGWSKISNKFNDNLGVSLVLINSKKGEQLFSQTKPYIQFVKSNTIDCLQPQLQYPAIKHPHREQFEVDFQKNGFLYVARKYGVIGYKYRINQFMRKFKLYYHKIIWHIQNLNI